jgi:hypothetical protein
MSGHGRSAVDTRAAAAAAYAAASTCETVPCSAYLPEWNRLELGFETAAPYQQCASLETVRAICSPCAAVEQCAAWAREDKYTGFAAGNWYYSGSRRARRPRVGLPLDVPEPAVRV